ncbi:hypothetical protein [Endozoicomonas sp. ALC020]|uniref:hypothetical protein n=1 Tax=unclassified Endozoicomonas TaxID=2644528 RepID=UPI003BB0C815
MKLKLGKFTGDCYQFVKEIQEESAQEKMRLICQKAKNIYRYAEEVIGARTEIGNRYSFAKDGNFEVTGDFFIYLAACFRFENTHLFQVPLPIECDLSNLATQAYRELYRDDQMELAGIACSNDHRDHVSIIRCLWDEFFEKETDSLLKEEPELVRWTVDAATSPPGHLHIDYCKQEIRKILYVLFYDLTYQSELKAAV